MRFLGPTVIVLATLGTATGYAQSQRTAPFVPPDVQGQQQAIHQQMYEQGQANAQSIAQDHAWSQLLLSGTAERNQQLLNSQVPPTPQSPTTTGTLR